MEYKVRDAASRFVPQTAVEELLQKLMQSFDDCPTNSGKLMRELLEKDRAAFLAAAVACLRQSGDSRAYHHLVALLAGRNLLAKCVCEPALGMPTALALARTGMNVHPTLHAELVQELANSLAVEDGQGEKQAIRTLEILGAISGGRRLLPLLSDLLQCPNPRVRAKVALLMGQRNPNAHWVDQRKDEADPRVRANAIEGLWDSADEGAQAVLWEASQDTNNRVAGNALIGLYRMGAVRAIPYVLEMAGYAQAHFRATAAWVMGESGDPRFLATLGRMLADSDKMVRARAFRASSMIRRGVAELTSRTQIRVHLWEARLLADGWRRLRLAAVDDADRFPPLAATQFLVTEGSQAITHYEVRARPALLSLAVGWAIPGTPAASSLAIGRILRECLRHQRASQQWALLPYSPGHPVRPETDAGLHPGFTGNPYKLAPFLEKQKAGLHGVSGPLGAARLLVSAAAPLTGDRHVVLVTLPAETGGPAKDIERLSAEARCHNVAVHGLALSDGRVPWLESLCLASGGRFLHAGTDSQIRAAIWRIFWGLQYHHEIHYWLESQAPGQVAVRVQVRSKQGIADDSLPLE